MNAADQATDLFYTVYLRDTTYYFVFTRDEVEMARIELDVTPHKQVTAKLIISGQLLDHENECLQKLLHSTQTLWDEAHTLTREYLQLHANERIADDHDEYGRVIFYMDLDTFSTIM